MLAPIVAARRESPQDDLISVLVEAELTDEDGTHRLTDVEIYTFSILLLMAGSGTTWKQMGLTLAALLRAAGRCSQAVREDRGAAAGPPSRRRCGGRPPTRCSPAGSPRTSTSTASTCPRARSCTSASAPPTATPTRWERPDEFDITRPLKPSFGFGSGPHVCLGMHVARAEMSVGIAALLDRLPNLRLDPDAEPPSRIGFYERGVMDIPVLWETP